MPILKLTEESRVTKANLRVTCNRETAEEQAIQEVSYSLFTMLQSETGQNPDTRN